MKRLQEPKYTGYIACNNFQKGTDPTIISKIPLMNTAQEDLQKRSNKIREISENQEQNQIGFKVRKDRTKVRSPKTCLLYKIPDFQYPLPLSH